VHSVCPKWHVDHAFVSEEFRFEDDGPSHSEAGIPLDVDFSHLYRVWDIMCFCLKARVRVAREFSMLSELTLKN
jgi:hypothetical protein